MFCQFLFHWLHKSSACPTSKDSIGKAEAWQRQLNDTTIRVTDRIKCIQPLSGEKPSALQLAARREKEKPSIRAQLKAAKEEQQKKPPQREKAQELEV